LAPQEVANLALLGTVAQPVLAVLTSLAPLEVVNLALLDVQTIFIFLPVLANCAFERRKHRFIFSRFVVIAAPAFSGAPCLNICRLAVLDERIHLVLVPGA
jgi:hypothetical protein